MSTNSERVKACQQIILEAENRYNDAVTIARNNKYENQKAAKTELAILKHKYEQKIYDKAKGKDMGCRN
jgi:hypothetical protein